MHEKHEKYAMDIMLQLYEKLSLHFEQGIP